jgi:FKBP-type peptidyl-prolyl cis-trans isomerase FkpA
MSVSTLAHPPRHGAALTKFWFGVAVVVAIAIGLAWFGAASLRGQTTASGLNIRTIEPGNGPFVKAVDGVLIDYEGRLPNGTVFDSSAGRGPQPLIAGQTIPGFSEALSHMQKGGRYRVRIPAKLAYGSNPPPGSPIPPNSDLDFDVHVDQVVPNAAMMAAQQQGAQGGQSSEGQPIEGQPGAGESAIPQGQ